MASATQRDELLTSTIEQVVARRLAGETLDDAAVIAAHPELMPELAEELRRLNLIRQAERLAEDDAEPDLAAHTSSPEPEGSTTRASDCFAGYTIVRRLHHGGQGVVYRAIEKGTQRKVAIKVIRQGPLAGRTDRGRFEREVQILRQLDHPRIASIRHSDVLPGGDIYFVMDYIPGLPLDVFMAGRTLTIAETLWLFARVCEAVNAAHLRGVIHRDLKPSNIRIDPENEPHILDFGLAKLVSPELSDDEDGIAPDPAMTITGQFIGSLPWASPEQAEGRHAEVDVRTDVYSLGVILYQMLTGRFPYDVTGGVREILDNILAAAPPPPSHYRQRINNELDTIVLKCLQKDRERRYQTAGELGRDIAHYLAGRPIEAKGDSPWYVLRKTLSRHRVSVGVAISMIVILAGASVISLGFWHQARRELHRAVEAEQRAERWLGETITARDAARSEARRAQSEAEKAEQVIRFLQDMLAAADPREAHGPGITVREALEAAGRRIESGLAGELQVQAALHATVGKTYQGLGLYEAAEHHLRRALQIRRGAVPPNDPDIGRGSRDLAELLYDRGRLNDAERLYREALAILQAALGAGDVQLAGTQSGLAEVLFAKSDFRAAEALGRAALTVQLKRLGAEHRETARTQRRLANVLHAVGDSAAAEPLLRQALQVQRKLLGAEHPAVAETSNALAAVLYARGDLTAAESLYREALAARRSLLGEHPAVAETLNDLAVLLRAREEYAEAESLCREALQLRRKLLGDAHPDVAESLNNLALLLLARGDDAATEPLLREALTIYRRAFSADHAAAARTLNNLAIVLAARRDYAAAEPLYRDALAMRRRLLGPEHPDVARTLNNLAELLRARGDAAAAEPLCREALEIRRKTLPSAHPELADSLIVLAMVLIERGESGAAEPVLRECLDVRRRTLPEGHWLIADTASVLGSCLATLREYEQAEPLLIDSFPIIRTARGDSDPRTREARARIVAFYTAWGKPDKAQSYTEVH